MINYSKQRELIIEILAHLKHPTAEQLYNEVHKNHPKISKSTVYRNLNVLVENKQVKKIKTLDGPDRFDYVAKEHYHAICKNCGKVFDFMYEFQKKEFQEEIEKQTRMTLDMHSIMIYGICEDCKSKETK